MVSRRAIDELLEQIWMAEEQGRQLARDEIHAHLRKTGLDEALAAAVAEGLLCEEAGRYVFTQAGRARAREVIRRHRLAERLMHDVLDVAHERMESNACRFEHDLSEEVQRSICVLLGHPTTCPHGRPIPPGPCCATQEREAEPVLVPLSALEAPAAARVAYIATHHHERLDRLAGLGLVPGALIHLHQRRPSYIIFVGETNIALDEEVARDIYVRPLASPPPGPPHRHRHRWGCPWRDVGRH